METETRWADVAVKACGVYYCLCGLVLFVLDLAYAKQEGTAFAVGTQYS